MADAEITTPPAVEPEPELTPASPRRRISRWRIAGLVVAALVLGGAIAFAVSGANEKTRPSMTGPEPLRNCTGNVPAPRTPKPSSRSTVPASMRRTEHWQRRSRPRT